MLQDGLNFIDDSVASNFQIQNGTSLPVSGNNTGELFYLTSGTPGLYVYDGASWEAVSVGSVSFDSLVIKQSCRAATTTNVTLSGTQTIDGVALVTSNRVLVKNQSTASQNGIYVVAPGAWARATDFDGSPGDELDAGAFTFVQEGTANADTGWVLVTDAPITVGSTALNFAQFTGGAAAPAGPTGAVQFNDGSAVAGDARFAFDPTTMVVTLGGGSGVPAVASILGGNATAQAGDFTIRGVRGPGSQTGGNLLLQAGRSQTIYEGGGNTGPDLMLYGGGGGGSTAPGGTIRFFTSPDIESFTERFRILANGAWSVGSNGTSYGTSGQVLTSNGNAAPTWQAPGPAGAAGPSTSIQYNDGGSLGGSTELSWNNTTKSMIIGGTTPSITADSAYTDPGTPFTIKGGDSLGTSYTGGTLYLLGGNQGGAHGSGGAVVVQGGFGTTGSAAGGAASVLGGTAIGYAGGGVVNITGGAGNTGASVNITGGTMYTQYGSGDSGHVYITGGGQHGQGGGQKGHVFIEGGYSGGGTNGLVIIKTANTERLRILANGAWSVGSGGTDYGTSGQVLTSNGNAAPTWQAVGGGAAAAGTLTGTTLASNVVTTSITSTTSLTLTLATSSYTGSTAYFNPVTVTTNNGTPLVVRAGSTSANGNGGEATFAGGTPAAGYSGGALNLRGGDAASGNTNGGQVILAGGNSTGSGAGGNVTIQGGYGGSGADGYVRLLTDNIERLRVLNTGAWSVGTGGAAYGTSGQVLTSAGNAVPTWSDVPAPTKIPRGTSYAGTTADVGKRIVITAGVTIPQSVYAAGDVFSLYNNSATPITVTQGSGLVLHMDGTTYNGNVTLAPYGTCTIWFNTTSDAVISGSVS